MPERLDESPNPGVDGLPATASIYPKWWKATVFLTAGGTDYGCSKGERWTWKVGSLPSGMKLKESPDPGCSATLEVSQLGKVPVRATPEELESGRSGSNRSEEVPSRSSSRATSSSASATRTARVEDPPFFSRAATAASPPTSTSRRCSSRSEFALVGDFIRAFCSGQDRSPLHGPIRGDARRDTAARSADRTVGSLLSNRRPTDRSTRPSSRLASTISALPRS